MKPIGSTYLNTGGFTLFRWLHILGMFLLVWSTVNPVLGSGLDAESPLKARIGLNARPVLAPLPGNAEVPVSREIPIRKFIPAPDSLPTGMPLVTRLFWGNKGLFRVTGIGPDTRNSELRLRRRMLQWHQRMGLLTLAAMTAQVVTGSILHSNPQKHYENLQPIHKTLGYTTYSLYSVTASLSLFAPPARRYGEGFSSIKLHRYLAIIHFSGMMVQPWLGRAARNANSLEKVERYRDIHKWVGIATYTAFTSAVLSIALPF